MGYPWEEQQRISDYKEILRCNTARAATKILSNRGE